MTILDQPDVTHEFVGNFLEIKEIDHGCTNFGLSELYFINL